MCQLLKDQSNNEAVIISPLKKHKVTPCLRLRYFSTGDKTMGIHDLFGLGTTRQVE
jgi:hypothetical protein